MTDLYRNSDAYVNDLYVSDEYFGDYSIDHPEVIFKEYSIVDNKIIAYLGVRRIAREIDIIQKETKNMSDKDKIIYVYDYVSRKHYDYVFTGSMDNQSIYSFYSTSSTVCAGFAKTSQVIFQNIGINSYLVHGSNHMWNYVEYEGKFYVFDATVGACQRKGSPAFYEGLGRTTIGETTGLHEELYPPIEETALQDVFGI
ncbi:MAG: hypothetical protein IKF71_01535 [Bacilli bacterium]|nr:hypothetical protein [Bacilli bacterium]